MAFSGLFSIMKSSNTKWDQVRKGGKRGSKHQDISQTMYRRTKLPAPGYTPLLCSVSTGEREREDYREKLVEENCGNLLAAGSGATV